MSDPERKYDREEVGLVLRRVAELQRQATAPGDALSRQELEAVIVESGLDVRHLDAALVSLANHDKRARRYAGLRTHVIVERSVSGELSRAKIDAMVALLNRALGVVGDSQISDAALSWFARHVSVSVSCEDGLISIQIEERFMRTARGRVSFALASAVPISVLCVSLLSLASPLAFGLVAAAVPLLAYGGTRAVHERGVAQTETQLEALADQLVDLLVRWPKGA